MSDTGKTMLWIVVAIVVIAVIIWLFVSAGRRREVEARRFEAGELRATGRRAPPEVQDTEDRASVTAAMAADARADAPSARPAEAERQAAEAGASRSRPSSTGPPPSPPASSTAGLEREADRVDPDVPTDDEGYRVDDGGNRLPGQEPRAGSGCAAAGAAGAAGLAPSAPRRSRTTTTRTTSPTPRTLSPRRRLRSTPETSDGATESASDDSTMGTNTVDHTPHESRDDVSNDDATTRDETTTRATSESAWEGSSATGAAAAAGTGVAAAWASRSDDDDDRTDAAPTDDSLSRHGADTTPDAERSGAEVDPTSQTHESAASAAGDGERVDRGDEHGLLVRDHGEETVSVPALEDRDEYLSEKGTPDDDPGDHRGQPWATTSGTPAPEERARPPAAAAPGGPGDRGCAGLSHGPVDGDPDRRHR